MADIEIPNAKELEEARGRTFTRRVALTTAIFAVLLAITSLGGNNATKEMMLSQQQSADQWAFYQSKTMREHLYRGQKMRLEADLSLLRPADRKAYEGLLATFRGEEERYRTEKKKIEGDAKKIEETRDRNMAKDPYFDYAEVMLQIAIVLASISILSLSLQVFLFSMVWASLGTVFMINGYLLIFRIPFFN